MTSPTPHEDLFHILSLITDELKSRCSSQHRNDKDSAARQATILKHVHLDDNTETIRFYNFLLDKHAKWMQDPTFFHEDLDSLIYSAYTQLHNEGIHRLIKEKSQGK